MKLPISLLLSFLLLFLWAGCSYYLPGVRLESPEVLGRTAPHPDASPRTRFGSVGIGNTGGVTLNSDPTLVTPTAEASATPDDPYYSATTSFIIPFLDGRMTVTDQFEVGIRILARSPFQLRAKYQLSGEPASRSEQGNFSLSATAGLGFAMGAGEPSGTNLTYLLIDASLIAGYRLWNNHLFWLGPTFGMATLSGSSAATPSRGATNYGPLLGYQYRLHENLALKGELAYLLGSASGYSSTYTQKASGFFLGLLFEWLLY